MAFPVGDSDIGIVLIIVAEVNGVDDVLVTLLLVLLCSLRLGAGFSLIVLCNEIAGC